jgi:septum formation protein
MKVPLTIRPSDVEEVTDKIKPKEVVEDLARLKGHDIFEKVTNEFDHPFVIASDTIVVIDDEILGKPKCRDDARAMLSRLSGSEHEVYTAVYMGLSVAGKKLERTFSQTTHVKFKEITNDIMDLYLEGDEALDKAGAYGIQGQGLLFVDTVRGSYSNVVGFPLSDFIVEMKDLLNEAGLDGDNWRSLFV